MQAAKREILTQLSDLKPGQIISRQVFHRGYLLLENGTVITPAIIEQLKNRSVRYVPVETTLPPSISECPETVIRKFSLFETDSSDFFDAAARLIAAETVESVGTVLNSMGKIPCMQRGFIAEQLATMHPDRLEKIIVECLLKMKLQERVEILELLRPVIGSERLESYLDKLSVKEIPDRTEYHRYAPDATSFFSGEIKRDFSISDPVEMELFSDKAEKYDFPELNFSFEDSDDVSESELNLTYLNTVEFMLHFFSGVRKGIFSEFENVQRIARRIALQSEKNPAGCFELCRNSTVRNYVICHSVNVAYLASIIGKLAGFTLEKRITLALSGLLHDCGMALLDFPTWNCPKKLDKMEFFDIMKHTVYGIDLIHRCSFFPKEVAYVCYNHHESIDGSGYPKGKKGNLISDYSQIVSICDRYEAIISSRVYRRKKGASEALHHFLIEEPEKFNQNYVSLLKNFIQEFIEPDVSIEKIPEKTRKIILLDDEPMITTMLHRIFQKEGYLVETFNEPEKCCINIEKLEPDMLFTDIDMGESDGFEVCRFIREKSGVPWLPIMIFSARHDRETVDLMKKYQISGFIVKPMDVNGIVSRVKKVVGEPSGEK